MRIETNGGERTKLKTKRHGTNTIHKLWFYSRWKLGVLLVCLVHIREPSGLRPGLTVAAVTTGRLDTTVFRRVAAVNTEFSEGLPAVDLGLVHPARQLEVPPGQPCLLGAERLRLGRVPQGAVLSRVISIRNCLPTSVSPRFGLQVCFRFVFDEILVVLLLRLSAPRPRRVLLRSEECRLWPCCWHRAKMQHWLNRQTSRLKLAKRAC